MFGAEVLPAQGFGASQEVDRRLVFADAVIGLKPTVARISA